MFFSKVQEQDQYHQTIRNLVVVIGSLFSNMVLVRQNHKTNEIEEKILVPSNFANRDKMFQPRIQTTHFQESVFLLTV